MSLVIPQKCHFTSKFKQKVTLSISSKSLTEEGKTLLKIVLLGDTNVGKTSIIMRYGNAEGADITTVRPTLFKDFIRKDICVDGREYRAHIFDTAGQERYHAMTLLFKRSTWNHSLLCS